MKWKITPGIATLLIATALPLGGAERNLTLRPPAVPLVACDPYFSIWSPSKKLAEADTVHWTGKPHRLGARVSIDGRAYRVMGAEPEDAPALPQVGLAILPTRTIYTFEGAGVRLKLTFMTAALPEDLMVYSRPVTYLDWEATALDHQPHQLTVHFQASGEICVNQRSQEVASAKVNSSSLHILRAGSTSQPILQKKGDDLRIDWGYFFVAAPKNRSVIAEELSPQTQPGSNTVLSLSLQLSVSAGRTASAWLMLAYDDEFSIQYFKKNLRPYWRRNGDDAMGLLAKAARDHDSLKRRCERFDEEVMSALERAGGPKYAEICCLAYRQCCAANKVVADENGQPLMFPKENFSNGCIGTVDVIYPMAPQFLFFSPSLMKATLVPILDYARSARWRWPFAPHDLGTYPLANGQVYGGGERTEANQMPVEETGNMLILLAALAEVEGNAKFSAPYWPLLNKWVDYLKAKGFDPENQLCTDDFAGHLAHNVNLSAKAICGLGSFAKLCAMSGDKHRADELHVLAKQFAGRWMEAAEGDHSRLAFDKPETWSQKYNLVWDGILGLHLFPPSVTRTEMDYYRRIQNEFGLPLDNRKNYTKLDWTLWSATLTGQRDDFDALVGPVHHFLDVSTNRVPMTDWYDTKSARMVGFQARSVVGGVFLKLLYDGKTWKHWARRDKANPHGWAELPVAPRTVTLVPTSESTPQRWHYTFEKPAEDWAKPGFDDSSWKEGLGGFGTRGTPGAIVRTQWRTPDIWLRREISIPEGPAAGVQLRIHHDEDAEIFINGVPAASAPGFSSSYDSMPLSPAAVATLKAGRAVLAVHCHQTTGGQYVDAGLERVLSGQRKERN